MADLKIGKLPDLTPIKLSIVVTPDLNGNLAAYAEAYHAAYGRTVAIVDLIPFMLQAFINSDRAFLKSRTLK